MTDFQVVPDDVDKFSGAMRDLAGQAGAAGSHATKWFNLSDAHTGIFVEVKGIVEHIRQNLEDNYKHLQTLGDGSATELAKAAQLYRTTDYEHARQLDEIGRRVGDFLQDISDLALLWLASQAAEAVLASSLVGAPAAAAQAAVSAAYLVQIVAKVGELIKLVTTAYKAIYGMIGLLNALSSQTTPENLPALPNSTYDHPGV